MTIEETYRRLHRGSAARYERAQGMFPSGVTHDGRYVMPFPLYVERGQSAYKWDVDGNQLIDYWIGHGALLLGHAHPAIVAAVTEQMARGTHYGAEHDLALRWAALVQKLFPSVEQLRFTASGTEATMLALRLARAYTGKPIVVRLVGHYHGWHDLLARDSTSEGSPPGVHRGLLEATIVLPADLALIEPLLAERSDIAAVILEPTGASYGALPLEKGFLRALRRLTTARSVLLICDEVVTGFRVAPGGAQQLTDVSADLTALAKVLAGGLPGGAIGGRADIMRHIAFSDNSWNSEQKIRHNGTFNANPLSAAAGVATLEQVATGEPGAWAAVLCEKLIGALNGLLRERGMRGWAAYGGSSIFHLLIGSSVGFDPGQLAADVPAAELKTGGDARLVRLLRLALNNHGVDLMRGRSGFLSAAHSEADIDATIAAFGAALDDIMGEL
jgi:glutamate-1-semialdehyde 2,1-aminomutase